MMLLLLFPLAAAVTFGVLSRAELRRFLPFWAPAVVIWLVSIGREPSVVFLILFLAPTIVMGVAVARHKLEPGPFLLMALSDIALAIALSLYQSKTALWSLPDIGAWGSGAGLAAGAAILRLGAAANDVEPREGGLISVGWWQGAMLAYWVGGEAAAVLVTGGVLLWGATAYFSQSNLSALSLAGGVLAVAAGLGSDVAGVIAIGLAGTAMLMGERVAATWVVAILPLSLLTMVTLPGGPIMALPALIFPGAWAAMTTRLTEIKPLPDDVPFLSSAAGLVGFAFVAALASSFFTGVSEFGEGGIPVQAINAGWLLYAAGLAGAVTMSVTSGAAGVRWDPQWQQGRYSKTDLLVPKLVPPVAWFSLFVATAITVRLLLAGFRTAFL
ncbi:MAG TPA: hypothetical protein VHJ78_08230 [Actinomycetota bacterium]|nr:hypothetical protein [Actinomycetota bacterium]